MSVPTAAGKLYDVDVRLRPSGAQGPLVVTVDKAGKVYVLPKHLDEKVARLHLMKIGAQLTELSPSQASYIGVKQDGPYKPDHYRY